MPVPGTQDICRALLEILREGNPQFLPVNKSMILVSEYLGIDTVSMLKRESEEFKYRITESLQYLIKEHIISNPSRNTYMIIKKGKNMLDRKSEAAADEKIESPQRGLQLEEEMLQPQKEADEVSDVQEQAEIEALSKEIDGIPDELDMTADEPDTEGDEQGIVADEQDIAGDEQGISANTDTPENPETTTEADQTPELDSLPDKLDLTADEPDTTADEQGFSENADTPENPETATEADQTPELDSLPDDLDLAGDDAEAENPDTHTEETYEPESSEATSEDSGIQATQQDTDTEIAAEYTLENSLDSDTDTLNYTDEVDPDMPKDDLPADDFSATEDFSSAVNHALNIEDVFERHNSELADKVLMRAAGLSQEMFAVFVTDLLSKMGYNAFQTARYTSDSSGSSMIQGVILDPKAKTPIYIHADKLSPGRTVGRSDMHDFADELAEKGGTGIFATTGEFSEQAEIYAQDERIMLIDGKKLAGLMLANNFCVNVKKVFEVKELDEDSFSEYE